MSQDKISIKDLPEFDPAEFLDSPDVIRAYLTEIIAAKDDDLLFSALIIILRAKAITDKTFESVWDAIAESPEEAVALNTKASLMKQVVQLAHKKNLSLAQLGLNCAIPEERVEMIEKGKIAQVEIFDLFKLTAALGYQVDIQLVAQR